MISEKEKQRKGVFLVNNREYFALSHFTFTNQNYILYLFLQLSKKVANVSNYHVTI